ncbi:MAG: hypothetical protein EBR02_09410, partial [Alphaproteobacteria bacterium]|nr:hypothetical protein [Alphaproteobacteria bacterium]
MKISGSEPIKPAGGTKRTSSSSSAGGVRFADLLAGAQEASAPHVSDVGATAAVSNLLAMQEITEEEVRRKKLLQQGRNIVDVLENLRHQLLIGAVPMHTLRDLARNLAIQKQQVNFVQEYCMLVSRRCWDDIGPWPEELPLVGMSFIMTLR